MKSNNEQTAVDVNTLGIAVVTAAGGGIGRATVRRLLADQLTVVAVDTDADALQHLAAECSSSALHIHTADVTDPGTVKRLFAAVAELGELRVLVNGVGSQCSGSLRDLSLHEWQRKFDLNLTSVLLCSREALPLFERSSGDRAIINISSSLAHVADPSTFAYGAFKAALEQMTRSMALELAPQAIRVLAVAPGPVASTGGEADWEQDQYARINPLSRFATVNEIADVIAFLAAPAARYITGTTIRVDGGDTALGIGWGALERLGR